MRYFITIIFSIFLAVNLYAQLPENKKLDRVAEDIKFQNALHFVRLERDNKAIELLSEYLEVYFDGVYRARAFEIIGDIYFKRTEYIRALHYYNALFAEFHDGEEGIRAYYNAGLCHSKLDNGAKAQEIFKDIVTHYADFHIARQAQIQLDLEDILQ